MTPDKWNYGKLRRLGSRCLLGAWFLIDRSWRGVVGMSRVSIPIGIWKNYEFYEYSISESDIPRLTTPIESFDMSGLPEHNFSAGDSVKRCGKNVTSSPFTSQSAILPKSAANEAQGCWNCRVEHDHWVHSGALRACFEPTKISSTARGLTERAAWAVLGLKALM